MEEVAQGHRAREGEEMSSELMRVPKLLTVRELSQATGIPTWRLYELVAQGKAPPHLRIGKTFRFPEDGVVKWIHDQTSSKNEG